MASTIQFANLPIPSSVGVETKLNYVSVIFNKCNENQVMNISSEAHTPMWLGPKVAQKIHVKK